MELYIKIYVYINSIKAVTGLLLKNMLLRGLQFIWKHVFDCILLQQISEQEVSHYLQIKPST